MICPYCGGDMEDGRIEARRPILWIPGKEKKLFDLLITELHPGSVYLSKAEIFQSEKRIDASLCRRCGKVIVDYAEE